jgi:rhamnosyltransferase subunit B
LPRSTRRAPENNSIGVARWWLGRTFEPLIRQIGLDFLELGTEADYQSITLNPALWAPVQGLRLVAEWLILRLMRRTFAIVQERNLPGKTVMVAPLTAFGARIAQERLGIPLVTVCLQPASLRSLPMDRASLVAPD